MREYDELLVMCGSVPISGLSLDCVWLQAPVGGGLTCGVCLGETLVKVL